MTHVNMKHFMELAAHKQIVERLRTAVFAFRDHVHTADKQVIDGFIRAFPVPSVEDYNSLVTRCTVVDEYRSLVNSKRDALMCMLRMSVILWWWYQDRLVSKQVIDRLCDVLEHIEHHYFDLHVSKCGHGYAFLEFYVFMNEINGE